MSYVASLPSLSGQNRNKRKQIYLTTKDSNRTRKKPQSTQGTFWGLSRRIRVFWDHLADWQLGKNVPPSYPMQSLLTHMRVISHTL